MSDASTRFLRYERPPFVAQLPLDSRYTTRHAWLTAQPDGRWRVGWTQFATRQLGETVEHAFVVKTATIIACDEIIGWVEGFKAIVDIDSVAAGEFLGGNPALVKQPDLLNDDPLGSGWLYEVAGTPGPGTLTVREYRDLLDRTIDRLREQHGRDAGNCLR